MMKNKTRNVSLSTMLVTILAILAIVLGAMFVINAFKPTANNVVKADDSGSCGTSATWSFDSDSGRLTISGTGAMSDYSDSGGQPWENLMSSIREIIISDEITHIGDYAFQNCNCSPYVMNIVIGNSVESIGNGSFSYAGGGKGSSIHFGSGLRSVGTYGFVGCSLTKMYINSLQDWLNVSFASDLSSPFYGADMWNEGRDVCCEVYVNNTLITEIVIPDGTTTIGHSQFEGWNTINSIVIPSSVVSIEKDSFNKCRFTSVTYSRTGTNYTFVNGVLSTTNKNKPNWENDGLSGLIITAEIDGTKSNGAIADSEFSSISGLKTVRLNDNVNLGNSCFSNCYSLTDIYYSGTSTQWDNLSYSNDTYTFYKCNSGLKVHCIEDNKMKSMFGDNVSLGWVEEPEPVTPEPTPAAPSTGIELNIGVAIASLALVGTMFVVVNKKRKEDR